MRSNNQQENQTLTPMQKQAVLVCIVCALAALLTIGITLTTVSYTHLLRSEKRKEVENYEYAGHRIDRSGVPVWRLCALRPLAG